MLAYGVVELAHPRGGVGRPVGPPRHLGADALDDPGSDAIAPCELAGVGQVDAMALVAQRKIEQEVTGFERHLRFRWQAQRDRPRMIPERRRDLDLGVK